MGTSTISTQGTQGPQGVTAAAPKRIPVEQVIFMLMIQQCEKKADILKADKVKLEELTARMNKAGELLKKLNDAAAAGGASSTNAVSTKLTPDEIQDINLLIKELGITTLFPTTATLSPGLTTPMEILNETNARMFEEYQAHPTRGEWIGISENDQDQFAPAPPRPAWQLAFEAQLKTAFGSTIPKTLTAAQLTTLTMTGEQRMSTKTPNYDAWADKKVATRLEVVEDQKKYQVVGGMLPTTTFRLCSSASTMMQTELQVIGQHHQSAMTDANDDLGVQNNFLQAARSFIEELLKLSSGTIQRF